MIITFKDQATADIAKGTDSKASRRILPSELHRNALLKIALLNKAKTLLDINAPGLRLEKLRGNRAGQYSLRINKQYRICFRWKRDGVYEVEIVDYH